MPIRSAPGDLAIIHPDCHPDFFAGAFGIEYPAANSASCDLVDMTFKRHLEISAKPLSVRPVGLGVCHRRSMTGAPIRPHLAGPTIKISKGGRTVRAIACASIWEGEVPAEPDFDRENRLGGSLALP